MRAVPNDIVQKLIRHLPLILDNMNDEAVRKDLKLNNAVRLTKIVLKRLDKIENEQKHSNSAGERSECLQERK